MNPLEARLRDRIAREGPIAVADYMSAANAHYYATRDPLGAAGDFVTAPEISQMFGELTGLWLADLWQRAGRPEFTHYVELGPGRGTLAADALKAMRSAGLAPPAHLVETSPVLRDAQAACVPAAAWHDDIGALPDSGPLLVVANEFFDALPVRQYDADGRELRIGLDGGRFVRDGEVRREASPASTAIVAPLSRRIAAQGGAMVIMDYGHEVPGTGDTMQSVAGHRFADPFEAPGERDLTAHVDFAALAEVAREAGLRVSGPVGQGTWLEALGIGARASMLAKAVPERADEVEAARRRLTDDGEMGALFKVLALTAPDWPAPEGF